jgi:glycogen synthase
MLARGSLKHYARVWKSAHTLQSAGYEVIVLGSTRRSDAERVWRQNGGVRFQVVPLPRRPTPRRLRRAAERAERWTARRDRDTQRFRELRRGGQPASLQGRVLQRWAKLRVRRAQRRAVRARAREQRLRAATKAERARTDPNNLSAHEGAWWPIVQRLQPDLVHSHDISGLSTGRRAGRLGIPWIYDAHEPKRHFSGDGSEDAFDEQAVEHASRADAVISSTEQLAELLTTQLGLSRPPVLVLNAPSLRPGPAPQPGLREAAGVGAGEPLLVYAGVLTRHRRLDVVLEAMTIVPDVVLALGVPVRDPFTQELLDRAEALTVSDRVRLVPKVPPASVVPYVAEADVGVNPLARYPGGDRALPNKLFEYLHAGLPMVVSDSPAMAEIVRRHGLGEVAAVDDPRAWAAAIVRALEGPRYRDDAEEWERLKREWSWERQAERLLALYSELTGGALPEAGEALPPPLSPARSL